MVNLLGSLSPETWSLLTYVLGVFAMCTVMMLLSAFLGGRSAGRAKGLPFESGIVGAGSARMRLSAKFYLVAMFFVIFDLEAVFLYAWAIALRESGWAGFIEATIFILVLAASLGYLWRIGALEWAPKQNRPRSAAAPSEQT